MDNQQFDRWMKRLAQVRSRRGLLGALIGGAAVLAARRQASAQFLPSGPSAMCGGIAALPCPVGYECVDDSGDSCDPAAGGADCSGVCLPIDPFDHNPCAAILCIEGTTCCPQCGGVCIPHDIPCSPDICVTQLCNEVVCSPGEYCCNYGCSICAPMGGMCTLELCAPAPPGGEPCGTTTCGPGEYCCNASCGICAPLGGGCIELYCEPEGGGVPCGPTVCSAGQVCCNESCGICTPPDGVCIALYCG